MTDQELMKLYLRRQQCWNRLPLGRTSGHGDGSIRSLGRIERAEANRLSCEYWKADAAIVRELRAREQVGQIRVKIDDLTFMLTEDRLNFIILEKLQEKCLPAYENLYRERVRQQKIARAGLTSSELRS
jgi:hypothetical protein